MNMSKRGETQGRGWTPWACIMAAPEEIRQAISELLPEISRGFSNVRFEFKIDNVHTVVHPGGKQEHNVPSIFYSYQTPDRPWSGHDHELFKQMLIGYLHGWFHARGITKQLDGAGTVERTHP